MVLTKHDERKFNRHLEKLYSLYVKYEGQPDIQNKLKTLILKTF